MDEQEFLYLIKIAIFKIAKSENIPHSYTLIYGWQSKQKFYEAVQFIRKNGYKESFFGKEYTYFNIGEYKYWSMGSPLAETILINKAKI